VYVELYVPKSGPLILEFWEKVCGCLYHQLVSNELQTTVSTDPALPYVVLPCCFVCVCVCVCVRVRVCCTVGSQLSKPIGTNGCLDSRSEIIQITDRKLYYRLLMRECG